MHFPGKYSLITTQSNSIEYPYQFRTTVILAQRNPPGKANKNDMYWPGMLICG
jgi:hypothetical protein